MGKHHDRDLIHEAIAKANADQDHASTATAIAPRSKSIDSIVSRGGPEKQTTINRSDSISLFALALTILFWFLIPTTYAKGVACLATLAILVGLVYKAELLRPLSGRTRHILAGIVCFAVLLPSYIQLSHQWKIDHPDRKSAITFLNLRSLFEETPAGYIRIAPSQSFAYDSPDGAPTIHGVSVAIIVDKSGTYAAYFYLPYSDYETTFEVGEKISEGFGGPWDAIKQALADDEKRGFVIDSPGIDRTRVGRPTFSHKVILFTEHQLKLSEKGALDLKFQQHGLDVDFRDDDFVEQTLIDRGVSKPN